MEKETERRILDLIEEIREEIENIIKMIMILWLAGIGIFVYIALIILKALGKWKTFIL